MVSSASKLFWSRQPRLYDRLLGSKLGDWITDRSLGNTLTAVRWMLVGRNFLVVHEEFLGIGVIRKRRLGTLFRAGSVFIGEEEIDS